MLSMGDLFDLVESRRVTESHHGESEKSWSAVHTLDVLPDILTQRPFTPGYCFP
jgi:hypothetical protein